eukprot:TRINITY_DN18013_c0_g1_i2.p1 TRINITY_DN18013_c0_g1~~TRINITY_DN18013_c0_g1_i2.p1  ORF type:complete len:250 (+),score=22.38 TRINITY_DN18013_c0_g1_i2:206-955(+)
MIVTFGNENEPGKLNALHDANHFIVLYPMSLKIWDWTRQQCILQIPCQRFSLPISITTLSNTHILMIRTENNGETFFFDYDRNKVAFRLTSLSHHGHVALLENRSDRRKFIIAENMLKRQVLINTFTRKRITSPQENNLADARRLAKMAENLYVMKTPYPWKINVCGAGLSNKGNTLYEFRETRTFKLKDVSGIHLEIFIRLTDRIDVVADESGSWLTSVLLPMKMDINRDLLLAQRTVNSFLSEISFK